MPYVELMFLDSTEILPKYLTKLRDGVCVAAIVLTPMLTPTPRTDAGYW